MSAANDSMILVTGGTGYVGTWMIVEALRQGYRVRASLRSPGRATEVRAAVGQEVQADDRLSFVTADLGNDDGWSSAVDGCAYVLHVASPMGQGQARDVDLLGPARGGTLRVLKAAVQASIRRVVITSSVAAAEPTRERGTASAAAVDERTWTDPSAKDVGNYARSKTLAEKAAWEFIAQSKGVTTLATILPGMILGPVLGKEVSGSAEVVSRLLAGKVPALPRIGFNIVDVRDLVQLHLKAMVAPEASGQRFIAAGEFLWFSEIAALLRDRLGRRASRVTTRSMPDLVVQVAALFSAEAQFMRPMLGRRSTFSSAKAGQLLGFSGRPVADTVMDCAEGILAREMS